MLKSEQIKFEDNFGKQQKSPQKYEGCVVADYIPWKTMHIPCVTMLYPNRLLKLETYSFSIVF